MPIPPALVAAGQTAAQVGVELLLQRLGGAEGRRSGKEARRQADIESQARQVAEIGQSYINRLADLDPSAPELDSFLSFVEQKVQESPGPADEQALVRQEGERLLALVGRRASTRQAVESERQRQAEAEQMKFVAEQFAFQKAESEKRFQLESQRLETEKSLRERELLIAERESLSAQAARSVAPQEPIPAPALVAGAVLLGVILLRR